MPARPSTPQAQSGLVSREGLGSTPTQPWAICSLLQSDSPWQTTGVSNPAFERTGSKELVQGWLMAVVLMNARASCHVVDSAGLSPQ